jgi:hypothetical protein
VLMNVQATGHALAYLPVPPVYNPSHLLHLLGAVI